MIYRKSDKIAILNFILEQTKKGVINWGIAKRLSDNVKFYVDIGDIEEGRIKDEDTIWAFNLKREIESTYAIVSTWRSPGRTKQDISPKAVISPTYDIKTTVKALEEMMRNHRKKPKTLATFVFVLSEKGVFKDQADRITKARFLLNRVPKNQRQQWGSEESFGNAYRALDIDDYTCNQIFKEFQEYCSKWEGRKR